MIVARLFAGSIVGKSRSIANLSPGCFGCAMAAAALRRLVCFGEPARRSVMAKGQLRSNKEAKKPKKEKPKAAIAAASTKDATKKK
jgi:hypothetical protein